MQNRHMFHGQEDKRECKHTGKYSRGEGSMMEVGVGAEAESVKGARKEGAQGGQRSGGGGEWDGHQSLGGRLAGRRRRAGGECRIPLVRRANPRAIPRTSASTNRNQDHTPLMEAAAFRRTAKATPDHSALRA